MAQLYEKTAPSPPIFPGLLDARELLSGCQDFGPSLDPIFPFSRTVSECGNPHLLARAVTDHPEYFQAEEVVPGLAACLKDDDPAVRLVGAEALSAIQPEHPAIVPVFVDHVIHRDARYAVGFLASRTYCRIQLGKSLASTRRSL